MQGERGLSTISKQGTGCCFGPTLFFFSDLKKLLVITLELVPMCRLRNFLLMGLLRSMHWTNHKAIPFWTISFKISAALSSTPVMELLMRSGAGSATVNDSSVPIT